MRDIRRISQRQTKLSNVSNCLRCLTHPSVIVSVAMLIVNDHLLKVLYPSVLTGKISDFTGLYFFPFIIALVLSLIFDRSGNYQRLIGNSSFLMTALAFALVKTMPWANAGMESILQSLTGKVSVIAIDPTDLIALTILLPSWRLWIRRVDATPKRYAWVVFSIASLASMATSVIEIDRITHLLVQDNAIYVGGSDLYSHHVSYDNGMTWEDPLDVPDAFFDQIGMEPVLPKSICDAVEINQCFRVSGQESVEISHDGGLSWEIAWEVPPGRRRFMDRLTIGLVGEKDIDRGPYDIALVGSGEDRVVIVAMGNEGVLIGDADNKWKRQEVGSASPTPFSAEDPLDVIWVLPVETAIVLARAMLVGIVLNWLFWEPVLRKSEGILPPVRGAIWIHRPGKWLFGIFVFLLIGGILLKQVSGILGGVAWLLLSALLLGPFVAQLYSWKRLKAAVPIPEEAGKALNVIVYGTIAIPALGFAPFFLWSLGTIPNYSVAMGLSISITLGALVFAGIQISKRVDIFIDNLS